jgi:AcrR family transcriptional regulator
MPPRAGLDKQSVVQAAAALLDADGVDGLTLGKLAAQLGVQTPSLYNHVDGLPGLNREVALLNVRLLGERLGDAAIGKSGPAALAAIAQAYRAYIKEHPGVYMTSLRASRTQTPVDAELQAGEDRVVTIVLAVVASFGLSGEDALHAVRGLRSLVHGFATLEVAGGFGLALDPDESFRRLITLYIKGLEKNSPQRRKERKGRKKKQRESGVGNRE